MVPSVVWLQCVFHSKSTFRMVPFTCYGSQWCLALKCFLFKSVFLSKSTIWVVLFTLMVSIIVVWFQCVFHSKSIFLGFPFTFHGSLSCLVPSDVWLQYVFHSKSPFWVVPFTFYGSQCCLAPKCCLLNRVWKNALFPGT